MQFWDMTNLPHTTAEETEPLSLSICQAPVAWTIIRERWCAYACEGKLDTQGKWGV